MKCSRCKKRIADDATGICELCKRLADNGFYIKIWVAFFLLDVLLVWLMGVLFDYPI